MPRRIPFSFARSLFYIRTLYILAVDFKFELMETFNWNGHDIPANAIRNLFSQLHGFYRDGMSYALLHKQVADVLRGSGDDPRINACCAQDMLQAADQAREIGMLNTRDAIFMHLRQFFEQIECAQPVSGESRSGNVSASPCPPSRRNPWR